MGAPHGSWACPFWDSGAIFVRRTPHGSCAQTTFTRHSRAIFVRRTPHGSCAQTTFTRHFRAIFVRRAPHGSCTCPFSDSRAIFVRRAVTPHGSLRSGARNEKLRSFKEVVLCSINELGDPV